MDNLTGRHIKGYELQERIAAGGFGAVYRAHQSTIGREVAVKVILPSLSNNPDFIRRFEAEAQLIARLEHHFIVPLYDYWRDPDGAYLVMRYLRGGSLNDHIRIHGALSMEEAFNLFSQIAQGLHIAHRDQVIHRDIKPGNILLDEDGTGFLADFGVAKNLTTGQSITEPDSLIGSPEYLAPEQARSEPVTPQTDIYSLGVVLYEMLTGEHPFPSLEKIEVIFKHLNEPLPEITTLDASICDEINTVIRRATAKDPAQRYPNVHDMLQSLQQAAQLDTTATPTSLVELLTPREQEVMQLVMDGISNREIAELLFLTKGTVKTYVTRIYRKLNVRSRVQAIARARDLNFLIQKPDVAASMSTGQLPEPINPYKGLRAFQAGDVQDYFGREKLTQKVLKRLQQADEHKRFLALVGPSGSGKSSLVNAGVIPSLWRGDLPDSENWYIVDMLPGTHPMDQLEIALFQVASDKSMNLSEQLQRDERGLIRVAEMILPDDDSELLIVIDQFEEVFTLLDNEDERIHFLSLIREAVIDKRSRIRVIVTLRADYYDRPLQYPEFGELIRNRVETVLPLGATEIERAIVEPANRVGISFEEGLVSRIVADVHYQPGALPLLQYALTELFERRDDHKLTIEAYQTIGGTGGALAKRADEIYLEGNEEGQNLVRQLFLRLVTLGEGAEDTRRRVAQSELLDIANNQELMDEVIDLYAQSRLLSLDNDPSTRQPTVEVAHEAILREWERLRAWLNESRDDIRQERLIAQAAEAWKSNNRDTSYLLTGTRLEQSETWHKMTELALTPLESEYIQTSIEQARAQEIAEAQRLEREKQQEERSQILTQRSLRLFQSLVAVFLIASMVAGGLAIFALNQRNEALDARESAEQARLSAESAEQEALRQASIGLVSQARLDVIEGVPERAVPVILEALENYPYTWQAERALFSAVTENRILLRLDHHTDNVNRAIWSPDQSKLASVSADETAIIWDAISGEVIHILEGHDSRVWDVAWSPKGTQLATADDTGKAIIWDAENGSLVFELPHEAWINTLEWSPDGSLIATASDDETARIWNAETGEEVFVLSNHTDDVWEVLWSPSGDLLATSSGDGTVRLWDANNGEQIHVLDGGGNFVGDAEWSPDGTKIVTANVNNMARIWDASSGEELVNFKGEGLGSIQVTTWSPDGTQILTVENGANQVDGVAAIWDAATGERLHRLPGINDLSGGVWSPDGLRVAITDESEVIRIWDTQTGELLDTLRRPGNFTGSEVTVQWSADGNQIMVHSESGIITVFDATDSTLLTLYGQNSSASWSPDGSAYLHSDLGGKLIVADTETNNTLMTLPVKHGAGERWSPDGRYILSSENNRSVHLLHAMTGEIIYNVEGNGQITWSPDSSQFSVTDFDHSVAYIYDVETGDRRLTLGTPDNGFICEVEWSHDGTRIAGGIASQNSTLKIWDAETGEELLSLDLGGFACQIDWSPDDTRLVAPSDQLVHILDPETGEIVLTFGGHTGFVNGAEFSPDGKRIVSAGDDATRIWDANTSVEFGVFNVQDWQAHWSPDGSRIMTIGPSGVLRIWRVWQSTEALIDFARDCCVFRELTPEERVQFGLLERSS